MFLKSTTLWFHNKRKIFKELLKSSNKAKGFYDKSIITQIQNCIDIRNELAHWLLFFDSKQKIFFVESYLKDELKIREITNKGIEEISWKFYKCINEINILVWWKDYAIFKIDKKWHWK